MTGGTMIIGGKADGDRVPARVPRMEIDGEIYMLVSFREGGKEYYFYQLSGMVPAEVVKKFKVWAGLAKLESPKQ